MDWASERAQQIKQDHPGWQVWTVRMMYPPGYIWAARPIGHPVATINAHSPEELAEAIAEQETSL